MRRETTIDTGPRPAATASAIRSAPAWPAAALTWLVDRIGIQRRNRRDVQALAALDERQLADIGLRRTDVDRMLSRSSRETTRELR
ncbi:MAG: DUF1127 domain-containing protein [Dongiaceae bacterium]